MPKAARKTTTTKATSSAPKKATPQHSAIIKECVRYLQSVSMGCRKISLSPSRALPLLISRRMADRQGLRLVKSRSRDVNAVDYGLFALLDVETGGTVNPAIAQRWVCSWTIDEVQDLLVEAGQGVKEGAKVNEQLKSEWIWFGGMLLAMALISWVTLGFPL